MKDFEAMKEVPVIAGVIGLIGGLSILGGIILCVQVWPTGGYVWLFSGFVSGMLFFAAAAALSYLQAIREYAEAIARKLHEGGVAAQTSIETGEEASGAYAALIKKDEELRLLRRND